MKPYSKTTSDQEELFRIIQSLEVLEMSYRITTNTFRIGAGDWIRSWDIDEMEVSL